MTAQTEQIELHDHESARLERVRKVEVLISTLLRVGVITSLAIVVFGTILSFTHHPEYMESKLAMERLTRPDAPFPRNLKDMARGVLHLRGQSIVVLGLLLLIATPVLRVAVSTLIFLHQRDHAFTAITLLVLLLLILSFITHHAAG